ncbi:DUF572-domain-containing protein [Aspergillus heteromorphus CBS 117.55]|uniref:DUF572-domain-containing protein n=1 Tax=Aspergillus heteromorphus CBS 117.55 TaxID=1448321 RepID=A0A317UXI0_9EURO|nr:DUF572-domain-containing protein [Aspergillus heteromorphus CBS 117.55]PWY65212.1 DUF572-domain-containing protein [Aspergillus heteromorphus CBS 117.55]
MQGFNMGRYIPPDLEGTTTANALHKKHPLGARARHLHTKGSLIVRFEMPFAVWCTTCTPHETLIGQGVRFNAEKKKVGNYYSTPVYSFRMKHTACGGWIEIRTDPRNTEYVVHEGGRRRDLGDQGAEGAEGAGEIFVKTGAQGGKEDALAKLEGKVEDKRRGESERDRILELQSRQSRDWEDPYEMSRRLRRTFRVERKGLQAKEAEREALKDKMSLGIEVVDEIESDRVRAGMVDFGEGVHGVGEGGRRARVKPLFFETGVDTAGGRKGKGTKAAQLVADRKAVFRSELTGNTRAVVDPFLASDGSEWRPDVKRRKLALASGGKAAGGTRDDAVAGDETAHVVHESAEPAGTKTSGPVGLVDYATDSE